MSLCDFDLYRRRVTIDLHWECKPFRHLSSHAGWILLAVAGGRDIRLVATVDVELWSEDLYSWRLHCTTQGGEALRQPRSLILWVHAAANHRLSRWCLGVAPPGRVSVVSVVSTCKSSVTSYILDRLYYTKNFARL